MVGVAQLVRALGCGPGSRGFESRHPPHINERFAAGLVALRQTVFLRTDCPLRQKRLSPLSTYAQKILTRGDLAAQCRMRRELGEQVVFTNGCFDILHRGHEEMLRAARALGDCLMVGLNGDGSVRALKGVGRPVNGQARRLRQLAELEYVSYVGLFDELSVEHLVAEVKPDVLVKGGDYALREVVGRDVVESYGGRVVIVPFLAGYSTTCLIGR